MLNDIQTGPVALNDSKILPGSPKNGVLAYLHVTLVIFVAVHLIYFIYMLLRHSFARKNPKNVKKPANIRKINDSCSICLETLVNEAQLVCSHSFCAKCIIEYMNQISNFDVVCPMCRSESKLIFALFEKNEENKEIYNKILSYNHDSTSNYSTTFCFCLDLWKSLSLHLRHLTDLNNSRYSGHRKGATTVFIVLVFTLFYPMTQEYDNMFEFFEDFFYYIVLLCCLSEYLYKNFSRRFNLETGSQEETAERPEM